MDQPDKVRQKMTEAYQGSDLQDLLQHIAWTDIIEPRLKLEKDQLQKLLISAVLGTEPTIKDHNNAIHRITKEQIAGRVAGIDYIINLMRGILVKGEKAIADLRAYGINP